jgi:hypothetical protein
VASEGIHMRAYQQLEIASLEYMKACVCVCVCM